MDVIYRSVTVTSGQKVHLETWLFHGELRAYSNRNVTIKKVPSEPSLMLLDHRQNSSVVNLVVASCPNLCDMFPISAIC
jgi:hypothetical protein